MLHSGSFRLKKSKEMPRDHHTRSLTSRRRFGDVSHIKLTDIFKSLRRRRLRKNVSQRSSVTHSQSFPLPLADSSHVQLSSPDISALSHVRYRAHAAGILGATDEDCSSGMSTSSSGLKGTPPGPDTQKDGHFTLRSVPTLPTSPSVFQLRSASRKDYLVDRLEQHLRQLSLGDASPEDVAVLRNSSRDTQIDVCLGGSLPRTVDPEKSSRLAFSERDTQNSPHGQNVVPMILVTSADAKHAKPLPPSPQRPSRTPFGPSSFINIDHLTNVPSTKSTRRTPPDDPFATSHCATYPPNYNLIFRLPSFPSTYPSPSKYAPETPTPMCCDHLGDCSGDQWEVLHPPLVAGRFTLPPFKLPPLSTELFSDTFTPLPY